MDQAEVLRLQPEQAEREFSCGLEFKDGSYIKSDQYRAFCAGQVEIIELAAKLRRERGL